MERRLLGIRRLGLGMAWIWLVSRQQLVAAGLRGYRGFNCAHLPPHQLGWKHVPRRREPAAALAHETIAHSSNMNHGGYGTNGNHGAYGTTATRRHYGTDGNRGHYGTHQRGWQQRRPAMVELTADGTTTAAPRQSRQHLRRSSRRHPYTAAVILWRQRLRWRCTLGGGSGHYRRRSFGGGGGYHGGGGGWVGGSRRWRWRRYIGKPIALPQIKSGPASKCRGLFSVQQLPSLLQRF